MSIHLQRIWVPYHCLSFLSLQVSRVLDYGGCVNWHLQNSVVLFSYTVKYSRDKRLAGRQQWWEWMKQPNLPCDARVGDITRSIACGYHNQKGPWKSWFKRTSRLLVKVPKPNTVTCNSWRRKSPESSQMTDLLFLHYYDPQDFCFQNFLLFFFFF